MGSELKIVVGEEYKLKIDDINEFEESIFKNVYKSAAKICNEIIAQNNNEKTDEFFSNEYNNIISFTGERGTGKSSSMQSFIKALNSDEKNRVSYSKEFDSLLKTQFYPLTSIDTSFLHKKDTLLEIIISEMFLKLKKKIEDENLSNTIDFQSKNNLLTKFQMVYKNLKVLHSDKQSIYDQDTIDALSDLANGMNLKENLKDLIDNFLRFFGKPEGYLVIVLDDFDLNITNSYHMLEDIRKFLIQKNVLIFIACKIEQLHHSIKQEIAKNYEILLEYNSLLYDNTKDIDNKANKYLEKLIPKGRRLQMPSLTIN